MSNHTIPVLPQHDGRWQPPSSRQQQRSPLDKPNDRYSSSTSASSSRHILRPSIPPKRDIGSTSSSTTTRGNVVVVGGNSRSNNTVVVGSSDYLVLKDPRRSNHNNNVIDRDKLLSVTGRDDTTTRSATIVPSVPVSRLTQKLSKHKKTCNDFPADEITEGASTIDISVPSEMMIQHHRHNNNVHFDEMDSMNHPTIHNHLSKLRETYHQYDDSKPYGVVGGTKNTYQVRDAARVVAFDDETRNDHAVVVVDDDDEQFHLLLDVSRTSIMTSSSDTSGSGTEQIDSHHAVARNSNIIRNDNSNSYNNNNNHSLNTTSNSSLPTNNSSGTSPPPQHHHHHQQQQQQPHLPIAAKNRHNHYDWSYSEDAQPPTLRGMQQTGSKNNTLTTTTTTNHNNMNECDNSTLATVAISNTSMTMDDTTTPDSSFETTGTLTGPGHYLPITPIPTQQQRQQPKTNYGSSNNKPTTKVTSNTTNDRSNTTALRSPLEHDTLVIVEGREQTLEFRHTSLILQYASIELAQYFVDYRHDGDDATDAVRAIRGDGTTAGPIQYLLYVKVQDARDWCLVQPFLEPHAVQTAVVTPYTLPVLLPWFQQLKLTVLLQECDLQLLYHLVTPPSTSSNQFQSSGISSSGSSDNVSLRDNYLTVSNTILLGQVAHKAGLERTSKQAFIVASTWMKRFPNVWIHEHQQSTTLLGLALNLIEQCLLESDDADGSIDDSRDLDISFESIDSTVWESLFEPPEASYLFSAMIAYLPTDCIEQQQLCNSRNVRQMLTNRLCPYLIREGIQKHQTAADASLPTNDECAVVNLRDEFDSSMRNELHLIPVSSEDENVEMIADNETIITENLSSTTAQQLKKNTESQSRNTSDGNIYNMNTNPSLLQVAEEIHAGWSSLWTKLAVAATGPGVAAAREEPLPRDSYGSNSIYHVLSHTLSDQQSEMLLLQSPKELSEWLQLVWDKLCNPPIFSTPKQSHNNDAKKNKKNKTTTKNSSSKLVDAPPVYPTIPLPDRRSSSNRVTNTIDSGSSPRRDVKSALKSTSNYKSLSPAAATSTITANDDMVKQHALALRRTFAC